jgi:signal transduction histidine kinase
MLEGNLHLRILLIEDDEEDFKIIHNLLSQITGLKFELKWMKNYETGLEAVFNTPSDVCLLNYRLGNRNGLGFLREVTEKGCKMPVILLTGVGNYEIDLIAMETGAADYLPKDEINASILERSIRYAITMWKSKNDLRELSSKLLTIQEEERKKLSSELHDSIGQTLAALKYHIEMALKIKDQGDLFTAMNHLEQAIPTLQRSIEETRSIYTGLRPPMLDDLGLLATIDWLRREFVKLYPGIHLEVQAAIEEEEIPEYMKACMFRIAQESLNNAAKHSKAEWVDLSLAKNGNNIDLTVADDGIGMDLGRFTHTPYAKTLGLTGMRERAELTGGSFRIESAPGAGTSVRASWPMESINFRRNNPSRCS